MRCRGVSCVTVEDGHGFVAVESEFVTADVEDDTDKVGAGGVWFAHGVVVDGFGQYAQVAQCAFDAYGVGFDAYLLADQVG